MGVDTYRDCVTKQTFCKITGQTAGANASLIDIDLTEIQKDSTKITNTIFNRINTILNNINQFGNFGTRNPTSEELNTLTNFEKDKLIFLVDYNNILTILKTKLLSSDTIISKEIMTNLQNSINAFTLNDNRCNYCNAQGNCDQCDCDCDCDCDCNCDCDCDLCGDCNCSLYCTAWG